MKYIFLFFCFGLQWFSAQVTVKGTLLSSDGKPVGRANVLLMDKDNNIDCYTFSDSGGVFNLVTQNYGDFTLEINAMGYLSKKEKVSFIRKGIVVDLKSVILEKIKTEDIKEVVISRTQPIKLKKDTIEYLASKFTNGTEKNVEELLKKLPGVTVQKDGKIKLGNKEVERVMVENDDLFERGYQTLTQNMPSKPVEKVQILKNYSKNKLLKGVEKSESVAINLTLKEGEKGKWFGNVIMASTSFAEDMRMGKFNLMNFSKRKKIYALYNANNLGLNEMNGVGYLINPDSDKAVENVGNDISTLSMLNLHQKNYSFGDNRTNFNNDQLASISYIYNFNNNWKLKTVGIYNTIENRNYTDSYYHFDYGGTAFTNTESKTWKQNNKNLVGKIEITKEFKNKNLVFYSKVSSLTENNDNQFVFNGLPNFQNGNNQLFASENRIVYTQKIDSTAAIVAVARYIHQTRPYNFVEKNNLATLLSGNANAQLLSQNLDSGLDFGGAKFSWLKNYSENKNLQISTGIDLRNQQMQSDFKILDNNMQPIYFNNSDYQNNLSFSKKQIFNQIDYKIKWGKNKWNFNTQLLNEFLWTTLYNQSKNNFVFSPSFNLSYSKFSFGTLSINAEKRYTTTTVDNLYTGYLYQGNRNFKNNNVGFTPLASYSTGISYNKGDQITRNFSVNLNYSRNEDYLSSQSLINPNYSTFQTILVKNNEVWNADIAYKKYVKYLKSRVSISGNLTQSDYQSSINYQPLLTTHFTNAKMGVEMKSGFLGKFNYEWGYNWRFNFVKSDNGKNNYTDQNGFVSVYYNFSSVLKGDSKWEYYKSGNSAQKPTLFWDINLNYQIAKWKSSVFVAANNLLNTREIRNYSIDNVSESAYTQRLLPLHIVVGFDKSF